MNPAGRLFARLGLAAALLLGALQAQAQATAAPVYVRFATTMGAFTIELDPVRAPLSTANFTQYVQDKHYDGTIFHRVVSSFVAQGGGHLPDGQEKPTRPGVPNESGNGLSNRRGTVAMARTNDPNSATSQFFINVKDNIAGGDGLSDLDPGGVSPEGYAVFGKVTEGMDIVDTIAAVETGTRDGFQDVPVEDIVVHTVRRLPVSAP